VPGAGSAMPWPATRPEEGKTSAGAGPAHRGNRRPSRPCPGCKSLLCRANARSPRVSSLVDSMSPPRAMPTSPTGPRPRRARPATAPSRPRPGGKFPLLGGGDSWQMDTDQFVLAFCGGKARSTPIPSSWRCGTGNVRPAGGRRDGRTRRRPLPRAGLSHALRTG
jgi:hypothetical protein